MSLKAHAADDEPAAWRNYTAEELAWWVRLLCKRAGHRADTTKRRKDLYDAGNYLDKLREHAKEDATAVDAFTAVQELHEAAKTGVS